MNKAAVTSDTIIIEREAGRAAAGGRHWTVEEFYRAIDDGVFAEPKRLELIQGRIINAMPPSPLHVSRRARVTRRLRDTLEPRYYVLEETPVHVADDSEPIPDVLVVRGQEGDYDERHPSPQDVLLLVEVAVSSADDDLGWKALLYAQAGVSDYWVALPERGTVVVHHDPTPEGYESVTTAGLESMITPLAAEDVRLSVRDLLGR